MEHDKRSEPGSCTPGSPSGELPNWHTPAANGPRSGGTLLAQSSQATAVAYQVGDGWIVVVRIIADRPGGPGSAPHVIECVLDPVEQRGTNRPRPARRSRVSGWRSAIGGALLGAALLGLFGLFGLLGAAVLGLLGAVLLASWAQDVADRVAG